MEHVTVPFEALVVYNPKENELGLQLPSARVILVVCKRRIFVNGKFITELGDWCINYTPDWEVVGLF